MLWLWTRLSQQILGLDFPWVSAGPEARTAQIGALPGGSGVRAHAVRRDVTLKHRTTSALEAVVSGPPVLSHPLIEPISSSDKKDLRLVLQQVLSKDKSGLLGGS
jgi:hypothetical protein